MDLTITRRAAALAATSLSVLTLTVGLLTPTDLATGASTVAASIEGESHHEHPPRHPQPRS